MADPRVQGIVEFVLKEKGLLEAKARLRELEREVDRMKGGMFALGQAGTVLGGVLKTYIAPLAVFNFFRTATVDMLQFQRQLEGTAATIRALGGDAGAEMPRIQAFLGAIQNSTAIIDDETLPAFQRLLGITESVPAALEGVALAARVTRSGLLDFAQASQAITDVLSGRLTGAAKSLGVALKDANGNARDAAEVFSELGKRLDELNLEEKEFGVRGLRAAWDQFSDAVGVVFIPTMNAAARIVEAFLNVGTLLFKVIEGGAIAFANLSLQIANVGTGIYGLLTGKGLEGFSRFDDATEVLHQDLLDLFSTSEKVDSSLVNTTKNLEEVARRIRGTETDSSLAARLDQERALLASRIALAEQGSRQKLELELRAVEEERAAKIKAAGQDVQLIGAIYETYDNKRRKLEADFTAFHAKEAETRAKTEEETLRRAETSLSKALADAKKITDARAEGEEKLRGIVVGYAEEVSEALLRRWEVERDAQDEFLETYTEYLQSTANISETFGWQMSDVRIAQEAETLEEIAKLQVEALERQRDREIAAAEAIGAETASIRAKYDVLIRATTRASEAATSKLYQESAEFRKQFWEDYATQSIAALGAVFGQEKAAAIAAAAISTAMGIARIWEHWAWNPPVAGALTALAVVQFAAQMAAIKKANFSSSGKRGFDDPMSDREAYYGGQRWAKDFVRETAAGFSLGLKEAMLPRQLAETAQAVTNQSSTMNDYSTGQVIHVHGDLIDSDSLRAMSRRLQAVERNDAARFQR